MAERRLTKRKARANAPDLGPMLESIAEGEGISLALISHAGKEYLRSLLTFGTHADALIRSGIAAADYYAARRSGQFLTLNRAVRAAIDQVRTEVVDDMVYTGAAKSEKLLMFHAERRDPRYSPPNTRQHGDGGGGVSIVVNILGPGQAAAVATVAGSSRVIDATSAELQPGDQTATKELQPAQNTPISGGFLGRVMGLQPSQPVKAPAVAVPVDAVPSRVTVEATAARPAATEATAPASAGHPAELGAGEGVAEGAARPMSAAERLAAKRSGKAGR